MPVILLKMKTKKDSYSIFSENKKLQVVFIVLLSAVTVSIVYIFRLFIWPFLFALVLYIALNPFYELVKKYLKRRFLSSLFVIFTIIILVLFPCFFVLISLADQAYEFYVYLQHHITAGTFDEIIKNSVLIKTVIAQFNISEAELVNQILGVTSKASLKIVSNLTDILTFSIRFFSSLFFMLLILFFLFKDGTNFKDTLYRILPFPDDLQKDIINRLKSVIKILFSGNIFIMFLQGIIVGTVFWMFSIRMPLLWGTVSAILSLVPVIGTALIWGPVVIYHITAGLYLHAIVIGALCFFGYLVLENLIKPLVFGEKLDFHPLIFFFLLLGSIQTFNLPGIIIGPVLLTLFYSLWEIYKILNEHKTN